ncbi:MAG: response regulator [Caldilineaceae bacterium]
MPPTIYIIEDDATLREALSDFLDHLTNFCVCGIACTAQEALEAVAALNADIVLVDVSLPDGNGVDLVRDLQVLAPESRCIVLSGSVDQAHVRQAMRNSERLRC